METPRNPIRRFRLYLEGQGWWNAEKEKKCRTEAFDTIIAEMDRYARFCSFFCSICFRFNPLLLTKRVRG